MRAIMATLLMALLMLSPTIAASEESLPVDQAFSLSVERTDGRLELRWAIANGYYLYRDHFGIVRGGEDVAFSVSEGKVKDDPGFGPVEVLYDEAVVTVPIDGTGAIQLTYQGCQDGGICYLPETRHIDLASLELTHDQRAGGQFSADAGAGVSSLAAAGIVISAEADEPSTILRTDSGFWIALSFLGFGMLLAFTPCVFPIYPIVLGMLGRQGETMSAGRGFLLSSTYVVSLALAFAIVGALVGWTGQNVQYALQSPVTTAIIAIVFLGLAAASFGWFELQLPGFMTARIGSGAGGRGSVGSAAALGFSSSLLVGPCVTAPLAGALVYIAQGGDWRVGALALFALGLGKGIPLIAMATFGGGLMPRAGRWMEAVRRVFGFSFIAMAVWIAAPLLPEGVEPVLYAAVVLVAAADLFLRGRALRTKNAALALAMLGAGLTFGSIADADTHTRAEARISRQAPQTLAFAAARTVDELVEAFETADGQPTMIYVTAEWCTTCRVIERSVFPDAGVVDALAGVDLVKLDVTAFDGATQTLLSELAVAGPPTILFFGGDRREVAGTRLIGYVSPDKLVGAAARAMATR